jgi:predicted rRNA methylase YqxC with S4 and FtsJ domains
MVAKERIDILLTKKGLPHQERAKALIMAGEIFAVW